MDHDGDIDIYASYGTGYVTPSSSLDDELYLNNGNSTLAQLPAHRQHEQPRWHGRTRYLCGAWGKQIREIREGESYDIVNSSTCHFGMGTNLYADSAIVRWPSERWTGLQRGGGPMGEGGEGRPVAPSFPSSPRSRTV